MDDVRYIATHPLLQRICKRWGELINELEGLAEDTEEKRDLEKRISRLEQYRLPRPTAADMRDIWTIRNEAGAIIGHGGRSVRQRLRNVSRGRPERHRIAVRAALEEKIRYPRRTWSELATKHDLESWDLERQVRLLRKVLKRESIQIPNTQDCRNAERSFERALAGFEISRRRNNVIFNTVRRLFRSQARKPRRCSANAENGVLLPEMTFPIGPGFSCQ